MPHGDHIIVLPGGGYERHADYEGEPVAQWLRGLGLTASVFAYPVRTRHPEPLRAIRGAITAARSQGATRVGLLGFSAGGHAASACSKRSRARSSLAPPKRATNLVR